MSKTPKIQTWNPSQAPVNDLLRSPRKPLKYSSLGKDGKQTSIFVPIPSFDDQGRQEPWRSGPGINEFGRFIFRVDLVTNWGINLKVSVVDYATDQREEYPFPVFATCASRLRQAVQMELFPGLERLFDESEDNRVSLGPCKSYGFIQGLLEQDAGVVLKNPLWCNFVLKPSAMTSFENRANTTASLNLFSERGSMRWYLGPDTAETGKTISQYSIRFGASAPGLPVSRYPAPSPDGPRDVGGFYAQAMVRWEPWEAIVNLQTRSQLWRKAYMALGERLTAFCGCYEPQNLPPACRDLAKEFVEWPGSPAPPTGACLGNTKSPLGPFSPRPASPAPTSAKAPVEELEYLDEEPPPSYQGEPEEISPPADTSEPAAVAPPPPPVGSKQKSESVGLPVVAKPPPEKPAYAKSKAKVEPDKSKPAAAKTKPDGEPPPPPIEDIPFGKPG
jgi:hypothetical protein